jgi:hypothetical protein
MRKLELAFDPSKRHSKSEMLKAVKQFEEMSVDKYGNKNTIRVS